MNSFRLLLVSTLLASPLAVAELRAQGGGPAPTATPPVSSARVAFILVDSLRISGANAEVVRRGGTSPAEYILVTPSVSRDELVQAMRAFRQLRARIGDSFSGELRSFIQLPPAGSVYTEEERREASALLERLRFAPPERIADLGYRRVVRADVAAALQRQTRQ